MDEKITAKVPLEFMGEAPAIKEKGAVVNKSMSEIEWIRYPGGFWLTESAGSRSTLNKF